MARPSKEPPSRSSIVPAIVRYASACKVDVEALAWRFDLPEDVARRDEVSVGADVADGLLQVVAQGTSDAHVALRVVPSLTSRTQALAQLAVRASANVHDALVRLARWVPLLQEGLEASLDVPSSPGDVRWILRTPRRPRGLGRHVHELALAHAFEPLHAGVPELTLIRAWFANPRPADVAALAASFGEVELAFGAEDSGFALERAWLERPMKLADARTVETLAPLVEAELQARPQTASLTDRIASHVAASLPRGTDVADVAREMHMSPRTLQRRLEQEGTRFSEVLDGARLSLGRRLLADRALPLTDVAFRLGFADVPTFSRAFKRWTGIPPGQWRRS